MSAEEATIPCGCFAAWTDDDHWEITSSSSHCDHNQFDRIDGAAPPTEKGWSIGRVPSDEGGPGHEEAYWLRQKLQASIVHLRDIEDYLRMSGTPRSMERADRARSLYEQISEDFVNGKIDRLTMRQRAEAAEARVEVLERAGNARVWYGHNDTCQSVLDTEVPYPCSCGQDALLAALASPAPKEGT